MAFNPLVAIFMPLLYLLLSTFVMLQFSVVLSLVGVAGVKVRSIGQLAAIEPVITTLVDYLTRVFGPLHKFTPQPTHILLMAVVVALVANGSGRRK
ncbi:hypothetical protein GPECTOR_17g976 [Gonium pectorale]|uniref:Uncharacterized protein n=1 Tax=Gonium pectorale TaxID=33097 RepID=A0A150GKT0_GONPE|nr:hypothetical protein GPECTOR_17g976 [Gonium pectorale]|eukprot:KXZ50335.1 hypothetical protein GPECTOR_17g976 [Gonium pectorale]